VKRKEKRIVSKTAEKKKREQASSRTDFRPNGREQPKKKVQKVKKHR